MKELQELRNEILTLRNYGVINKEEEKSLLTKLNSVKEQLALHNVVHRKELLLAAICEYNKYNTQKDIKAVDDWLKDWDSK